MLLAIDSATRALSLALHDGQRVCAEMTWNTATRHTVELAPAIQQLLALAGVQLSALSVLGVSQGPGSFNGLRIGISTAKGLAMARGLPLIAIPTLDIAAAAVPYFDGPLIAVAEVGRGRVCAGSYHWEHGRWIGADDVRIVGWEALLASISMRTMVTGEVDNEGRAALSSRQGAVVVERRASDLRRAGFLADLAWERWREGETGDPAAVVPFYLHQPGVPHP